jgi:hypothetical protein
MLEKIRIQPSRIDLWDPTFLCLAVDYVSFLVLFNVFESEHIKVGFHRLSDFACYNPSRRVLKSDFPLADICFAFTSSLFISIS